MLDGRSEQERCQSLGIGTVFGGEQQVLLGAGIVSALSEGAGMSNQLLAGVAARIGRRRSALVRGSRAGKLHRQHYESQQHRTKSRHLRFFPANFSSI
jgi:hypothetical protein